MKVLALHNALVVITAGQILAYSCSDLQCSKIIILKIRVFLVRIVKFYYRYKNGFSWFFYVLVSSLIVLWCVLNELFKKIAQFFVCSVP